MTATRDRPDARAALDTLRKRLLRTRPALAGGLAALTLLAAACGSRESGPLQTTAAGEMDYSALRGKVRIDGSSTVFPISEAVAEEFSKVSRTRVNVAFSGTGGGFEKFCRGDIEISDASRPIKDDEAEACVEHGIADIVELQAGIDALSVVVNPENDWAECLTTDQLFDVFRVGGASRWSDLDPAWPDKAIILYHPGTDSGTFDYFVEAAIEKVDKDAAHRGDGTASEDDNVLAQGVEGDRYSIGYFGFAYFQEAGQRLKAVAIDSGDGCVAPSFETALQGTYKPLSRPLFIYTREKFLRERPEVLGLVKFYLDNAEDLVAEVGYVALSAGLMGEQQAKVEPYLP